LQFYEIKIKISIQREKRGKLSALYSVEDNDEIEFLSNSDECGTTAALASGDPVDSSPDSSVFNGDTSQVFLFPPPPIHL
jgi:hypothetical protein